VVVARSPIFAKLNLKDQTSIVVLNGPPSFEVELVTLQNVEIHRSVPTAVVEFAIGFTTTQAEVDNAATAVAAAMTGDGIMWLAYPKGSSKNYTCEFNRDTGWAKLGELGFEPVRQVAIDADWSALRFRRVEFIKSLTRATAISPRGRARIAKPAAG
jgi:hypothetical protein